MHPNRFAAILCQFESEFAIANGIYSDLVPQIVATNHVGLINLFSAFGRSSTTVSAHCIQYFNRDVLHPNDKGYVAIANAVESRTRIFF